MFEQIYGWIQDITVWLIVSTAVLHAIPGKDYGKYIRFFSGLVLILLLATPILNLTGMKGEFEKLYKSSEYEMEKQEIESVEEFYTESGLSDYLPSGEDAAESDRNNETGRIEVGEIEIGE